jgi:raffinose/stachyose/melibiose transport system substrate-binding protein
MKKALVILLVLLMLGVSAFAGTTGKTGAKVVVKVMAYGDNSNPEGQNWIRIVQAFMKENPNIEIQYEMLYDEAYHQKVIARLASGDVPHVAYMGADARWGKQWADAKQQFDHKPLMDPNYYDLSLVPAMGPNGEIWEIPLGTSNICTVLYMNEALVKSLGLSAPKSYDDIKAMVPKAQAAGIDVVNRWRRRLGMGFLFDVRYYCTDLMQYTLGCRGSSWQTQVHRRSICQITQTAQTNG